MRNRGLTRGWNRPGNRGKNRPPGTGGTRRSGLVSAADSEQTVESVGVGSGPARQLVQTGRTVDVGTGNRLAQRGGLPDRVLRRLRAQGERRGLAGGDDQTGGGSVGVEMGHVVLVQLRQGVPGQLVRVLRRTREEDL